jgi:PKD repeat protein
MTMPHLTGYEVTPMVGTVIPYPWIEAPDAPFAYTRFDAEYSYATGHVYMLGGRLASGSTTGRIWEFDPATGVYTDTGVDMPVPVSNYNIARLTDSGDDEVLVTFGGRLSTGIVTDVVQGFYPASGMTVTFDADPYPVATSPGGVAVVDNVAYVFGGFDATIVISATYIFDINAPAGARWTVGPNLNQARSYIGAAVVDGVIYALGGDDYVAPSLIPLTITEKLDTASPIAWDDAGVADLPIGCGEMRAFGFDTDSPYRLAGSVVVAGCGQWPSERADSLRYDVASNTWDESFPDLNQARRNHAGAFIPAGENVGRPGLWVWGGRQGSDSNLLSTPEYYDLDAGLLIWDAPAGLTQPVTLTKFFHVEPYTDTETRLAEELAIGEWSEARMVEFRYARSDIAVSPPELTITLNPDTTFTRTLFVENVGDANLSWKVTENPARDWLSESPITGTIAPAGNQPVDVLFNATGLTIGVYTTTLEVTSNDPDEPLVNIPVALTVTTGCIPVAGADFIYTPAVPEVGEVVTFTGSVAQGTLPIAWAWAFGDGASGSGQVVTHIYTISDTYGVVLTATNGCPGQSVAARDVTVLGKPDIEVTPLALSATLNPGQTADRTLSIGNAAMATYELDWSLAEVPARAWLSESPTDGAVAPAGSTPVSVIFDATGLSDGVYTTTLRVSSNDPDEPAVDVSVTLTVTTTCIPVSGADFTFAPTSPYVDETVAFTGSVAQGTSLITYTWNLGDGTFGSGRIVTHTFPFTLTAQTYTVVMTAANGCPSFDTASHPVTVRPRRIYLPLILRNS